MYKISNTLIDIVSIFDSQYKVSYETIVTKGLVILAGEVKSKAYLDLKINERNVIKKNRLHKVLIYL